MEVVNRKPWTGFRDPWPRQQMVVGGSQQETLDPGFVLLGTRQKMVVGGSQQETLDPGFVLLGTRQHVPVILRELVLLL
ncbi:unnamed protein product [Schistosoma mattheei]|uniref:Uncharacterized protein n=1 Tax=Schistosoma mattheei TaxID=31246 RepID=A0A3P8ADE2_9TREM|nr:unnamed protein product [Schistosoma mattheei]